MGLASMRTRDQWFSSLLMFVALSLLPSRDSAGSMWNLCGCVGGADESAQSDPQTSQHPSESPGKGKESKPKESANEDIAEPSQKPTGYTGKQVSIPSMEEDRDFIPITDRWRLGFPEWSRRVYGRKWDPYNQNVLKGDYPILGQKIFLNFTASSESFLIQHKLPIPSDVSAANPDSAEFFGRGELFNFNQNFKLSVDLFQGDTAFKPVDWRLHVTPIFNINYIHTRENGLVNIDVRRGTNRRDGQAAFQELFFEYHLKNLSPYFDFVSIRAGIQHFASDFRGFVFDDFEPGLRLFGTLRNNLYQWNLAYFNMLEKDTNSGLNTLFNSRRQHVVIANLYRQDFLKKGYTAEVSLHYNNDRPSVHYDDNGFLVRPAGIGDFKPHSIQVGYWGWGGDGHLGRLNLTHQFYEALGHDTHNPIAGHPVRINAQMAAVEASYDRDWLRFKGSFFWASGESHPFGKTAHGFDTIFDNSHFAGGIFSFWQNQQIRLTQTGVALVGAGSLLPSLRSSKDEGQANFVNPGLFLYNAGIDADLTPKLRGSFNVNYLRFHHVEPLEQLLFQPGLRKDIGIDYSAGFTYRPPLNENVILIFGVSALQPGRGFKDIYTSNCAGEGCGASSKLLYAGFIGIKLTY